MHLAHVMSFYDIRCRLDKLFEEAYDAEKNSLESKDENYEPIRTFIRKLFEPDTEAVVNFGGWYPPLTLEGWNKKDSPWYEQASFRKFYGGKDNMKDKINFNLMPNDPYLNFA